MKILPEDEKNAYANWVRTVLVGNYRAQHEFRHVGFLPARVLADCDVAALNIIGDVIEISDYQLRHGIRQAKSSRGGALDAVKLESLPLLLETAKWHYNAKLKNIVAAFDIGMQSKLGKAVVQVNYTRKQKTHNAVITTGVIEAFNLDDVGMKEI